MYIEANENREVVHIVERRGGSIDGTRLRSLEHCLIEAPYMFRLTVPTLHQRNDAALAL